MFVQSRFTFLDDRFPRIAGYGKRAEEALGHDNNICLLNIGRIGEAVTELLCRHNQMDYNDSAEDAHKLLELGFIDTDIFRKIDALIEAGIDAFNSEYSSEMAGSRLLTTAQELCEWLLSAYGSSRFDFMADLYQPSEGISTLAGLAEFGREAEDNLYHNTRYCLICLGDIGETLVDILIDMRGMSIHERDQMDRINILHGCKVIDDPQKEVLHALRMARNKAVHNRYASEEEGKRLLEASLPLCEWMFRLVLMSGDIVRGRISSVNEDGLIVKIGAMTGRVPNSEIPDEKIFTEGERRLFSVMNKDGEDIALSMKEVHSDPWVEASHHYSRYNIEQEVNAVVCRIANTFGAFVKLKDGLQARIPESEYSTKNNRTASLKIGQHIKARVMWLNPRQYPYMMLSINEGGKSKPAPKPSKLSQKKFMELCQSALKEDIISAIENGADVNAKNHNGTTCLMMAVMHNKNIGVAEAMIENGADVNAISDNGNTALIYAAMYGTRDDVIMLIKHGADVGAVNGNKRKALHYARSSRKLNGDSEVLELLGAESVKLSAKDAVQEPDTTHKDTALAEEEARKILKKTLQRDILKICMSGSLEDIAQAIDAGVNINVKTQKGAMPLMYAAQKNTAEAVDMLIKAGAEVNAQDSSGNTALIYAASYNSDDVVNALLDSGADKDITNTAGYKALDYARRNSRLEKTEALSRL